MSGYKRIGILLGAFLAIALILAACGGGATPAPVSPATPTPKVEEPTAAPTQPPPTEEAAAEDLLDEVLKAGKLVVSTDPNYAPQSFLNDAGELDGFDVDVAKEVAKRLGVEVEFVTPEWDIITSGNWSARWDVSIGSMTPTEPRAEVLWFTDPYYYVPAAFAVHKDNTDINSPADLSGKRVGLGTATTYEDYLNGVLAIMGGGEIMYDPPPDVEIVPYSTDGDAIQDLALGDGVRLDAVMSAQPTLQTAIDSGVPLKYVGTPAFYEPLVFALDKSRGPSDKMLDRLNEIVAEMHKDGTLTELSLKWYGLDYTTVVAPSEETSAPTEKDLLDEVLEAGKLVVSTDPNYAPQSFLNDAGELDGFDVDVAKEVAKRLGVEVEFVTPEWDIITSGNWSARWDVSIGSMTPTEPRAEVLWFTDPYYYVPAAFAVHKDNTDINSPADLSGKRVGLGTATTYEDYLNGVLAIMGGGEIMYDPPPDVEIVPYSTDGDAIQDLALGDGVRLDAVMSAQPTLQTAIDSGVPLKYVGTPAFYEPLVFALDKSRGPSDKMLDKLNEIVAEMHKDGTLTELSLKWYGLDYTTVVAPSEETSAPTEKDLLDEVLEAGKLVVSTDPNYAPQSFLNDAGELDGFDVDVAKEVAKRLGVEVEFVTPEWDIITSGNWSARWDVSIGSMTPTEPRAEVLWFTDPYYYVPAAFAVHKDNSDINSPADLSGKRVGLGTATTYEDYLNGVLAIMGGGEIMYDPPPDVEIVPYSTDGDAIQDLALGDGVRLDAVMSAQPTLQTAIDSGVPLKYVGTPAFYEPLVFALDKSRGPSDKMLDKLNEIVAEMHKDGALTELSLKWYGIDYTTVVAPE